jgi:Fatty acid desaturase
MKVSDYLSRDEVAYFTAKSDWQAWRMVLGNWLAIAAIFTVLAIWPNPLTILLALVLLAGRQLGLSVLMHDCGHHTLFKTARLNDVVGQWLCAMPVMNDQPSYAKGHLEHHRKAGSPEDPDLRNYQAYPVARVVLYFPRRYRGYVERAAQLGAAVCATVAGAVDVAGDPGGLWYRVGLPGVGCGLYDGLYVYYPCTPGRRTRCRTGFVRS